MQKKMFATKLCSLLLLLLCIEEQVAYPTGDVMLPTTELAPASGSGSSGYGQPPPTSAGSDDAHFDAIYDMLVQQNRSIDDIDFDVIAGAGSGMAAVTPTSSVGGGQSSCNLFAHNVIVNFRGCVGTYPSFSCAGRCQTEQTPNYFQRREHASIDPFITTCKCCSAVTRKYQRFTMELDCPDGSTLLVLHTTGFIEECSCSPCF